MGEAMLQRKVPASFSCHAKIQNPSHDLKQQRNYGTSQSSYQDEDFIIPFENLL